MIKILFNNAAIIKLLLLLSLFWLKLVLYLLYTDVVQCVTPMSMSPNQSHVSLQGLAFGTAIGDAADSWAAAASFIGGGGVGGGGGKKENRSHSTTSLYPNGKRLMRDRKTVCSLHSLLDACEQPERQQQQQQQQQQLVSDCESIAVFVGLEQADEPLSVSDANLVNAPASAHNSRRGSTCSPMSTR